MQLGGACGHTLRLVAPEPSAQRGQSPFFAGDTPLRPLRRPRLLQTYDPLFASLAAGLGDGRIYLSPQFMFLPGLTHK